MSCAPNKKYIRRRRGACDSCKQRKVRCDGENPCTACHRSGSTCHYQPSVTRSKGLVFAGIDAEITNCRRAPPLYIETKVPEYDTTYDYSNFTSNDSSRSAISWNSEFCSGFGIPSDVECFQALSPGAEYAQYAQYAEQTTWAYPGDQVKEPHIPQQFDYQYSLPEVAEYGGYLHSDSPEQEKFSSFTHSSECLYQDHVLCSNEYRQDMNLLQPLYTDPIYSTLSHSNLMPICSGTDIDIKPKFNEIN